MSVDATPTAGPALGAGSIPARTPTLLWDVDLGAVISAAATLAPGGSRAETSAFVGTHAGRFVGVTLAGPAAGTTVVDLELDGIVFGRAATDGARRVFVGADDDVLYAVDTVEGDIRWRKKLGDCWPARAAGPEGVRCDVDGGPTVLPDGDLLVGADGVYRLGPDGSVRWHFPSLAAAGPGEQVRATHVLSTPVVAGRRIVFGGWDGNVTAVGPDGTLAWRFAVGADVDGTAAVGVHGAIHIGADDGRVYTLDSAGVLQWSFATEAGIRSAATVGPDGTLYVSSRDGKLYALDPQGRLRWSFATSGPLVAAPTVDAHGRVVIGSEDDRLYAVSAAGAQLWVLEFPADIDAPAVISPQGILVVGCDDGHLRALAPSVDREPAPG